MIDHVWSPTVVTSRGSESADGPRDRYAGHHLPGTGVLIHHSDFPGTPLVAVGARPHHPDGYVERGIDGDNDPFNGHLLHGDALREIPRLVDVGAFEDGDVVGEELQGYGVDGGGLEVGDVLRHLDHRDAVTRLQA
jgi:hypothetical protein